jgi:orotidine-5'-phosphate decarboxylase
MTYVEHLIKQSEKFHNNLCLGLDPVIERIPFKGDPLYKIEKFFFDLLNQIVKERAIPAAVKPNIAFYEQYGPSALELMIKLIKAYKAEGMTVILDAKRGDIGKTCEAYANACFNIYHSDSVTLAPYMGEDSIKPFQKQANKGLYVLARTSNKSATDFQDLLIEGQGKKLFTHVVEKAISWNTGIVVGGTYLDDLREVSQMTSNHQVPFLIPGIGSQGAKIDEVADVLSREGQNLKIHRLSATSSILYAHEVVSNNHYTEASLNELKRSIEISNNKIN